MTWLTVSLGRSAHEALSQSLVSMETRIMSKLNELTGALSAVNEQLSKAKTEIVARIDTLERALTATDLDLPEEVVAALVDLKATAQALDDLNPDPAPAPTDEPVAETPESSV